MEHTRMVRTVQATVILAANLLGDSSQAQAPTKSLSFGKGSGTSSYLYFAPPPFFLLNFYFKSHHSISCSVEER